MASLPQPPSLPLPVTVEFEGPLPVEFEGPLPAPPHPHPTATSLPSLGLPLLALALLLLGWHTAVSRMALPRAAELHAASAHNVTTSELHTAAAHTATTSELHTAAAHTAAASPSTPSPSPLSLCSNHSQPVTARAVSWAKDRALPAAWAAVDLPLQLHLEGCAMEAVGGEGLERCLRGRHLVFIGDSVTRYQYLNLAQRLTHGNWTAFHGSGQPLSEAEGKFRSWPRFMATTNRRMGGYEVCECFRDAKVRSWQLENRFYHHPALGIRLSFFYMGPMGATRYHALALLNVSCGDHCGCGGCVPDAACGLHEEATALNHFSPAATPEQAQENFLTSYLLGSLADSASLAPVDALVLSLGYNGGAGWPRESNVHPAGSVSREVYKAALVALTPRLRALVGTLVWKASTSHNGNDYLPAVEVAWVREALVPLGWQLFDAYALTQPFEGRGESFVDSVHFQPHVYRGLNQALALHLCGLRGGASPFYSAFAAAGAAAAGNASSSTSTCPKRPS